MAADADPTTKGGAGMAWLGVYVGCIVGANVAITYVGLVPVGFGLMAPAGVYFAGISFTARDMVQERYGRRVTVLAILAGAALSAVLSPALALASGCAFLLSELADMGIYTPLRERGHWLWAVAASNVVGAAVDSVLFLWLAFHSLAFLPGQLVGKWEMVLPAVGLLWLWRARRARVAYAR